MSAVVFYELLGFRAGRPGCAHGRGGAAATGRAASGRAACAPPSCRMRRTRSRLTLSARSPTGSRRRSAQRASRRIARGGRFLRDGTGPWRDMLEADRRVDADWSPPACGPVEYIERLGSAERPADRRARRAVRQTTSSRLASRRRHRRGLSAQQPLDGRRRAADRRFYASGVRVAIGTDSLASVEDLNMFSEMAEVRRLAPDVPARANPDERDPRWRDRAGIRQRARARFGREARRAHRRPRPGRCRGCGRIPGGGNPAV